MTKGACDITRELRPLTSLRFFAAAAVVAHHAAATVPPPAWVPHWLAPVFHLGNQGVTFFFVLSGFVLAYAYLPRFERQLGRRELGDFYVARLARIWPLHLVTLAVAVALLVVPTGGVDRAWFVGALGANVGLIQGWYAAVGSYDVVFAFNTPAWSLSVEALFYLLFPGVAWLVVRGRWHAHAIVAVALLAWLASLAVGVLAGNDSNVAEFVNVFPPARLGDFVVGIAVALVFLRRPATEPARAQWRATGLELVALGGLAFAALVASQLPMALRFDSINVPFIAAAMYVFASGGGVVSQVLGIRPLRYLGTISFSMFMVHFPILGIVGRLELQQAVSPSIFHASVLCVTLAIAALAHHVIEAPAMRAARRARLRRRAAVELATATPGVAVLDERHAT